MDGTKVVTSPLTKPGFGTITTTGAKGLDRTLKWVSTLINAHWSPDGKVLAAGSIDKSVHFWRAGAWLDSKMGGYAKKPQALAWSADSKFLATTGEDAIIVWPFAGKGPEGSKAPHAKLTEAVVAQIKAMIAEGKTTHRAIAKQFGVHFATISDLATGKTWRHV